MENQELEYPACNQCGSTEYKVLFEPKNRDVDLRETFSASHGILGAQRVVKCSKCGLIYVCPRLNQEIVVGAYEDSADELYVSQGQARIRTFDKCARFVAKYVKPEGRLLDVGAAGGFFLKSAAKLGWRVEGVEPSRWLADWGNKNLGVTIHQGTLDRMKFDPATFDVITMWDSIEHMEDPLQGLKDAGRFMKTGGLLVINTPDIGSIWARLSGQNWWFLLSHHLYYFTPKTMTAMLNKAGFDVVAIRRHYQSLELGHLIKMVGLYSKPISKMAGAVASALHIGGWVIPYYASQMNVIARKTKG